MELDRYVDRFYVFWKKDILFIFLKCHIKLICNARSKLRPNIKFLAYFQWHL